MFSPKRMSRRSRSASPVCAAESLEHRRLLALTVTASGRTAKIIGDGAADSVRLTGFSVDGLNGTQVNLADSFIDRQFSIRNYVFDMKGGDDTVDVALVFGANKITIKGGDGDNTTEVSDSDIKQLIIRNQDGMDTNRIIRTQIGPDGQRNGGKLDIRNGDGGSNTRIASAGPGSGQSMHTNNIIVQNGDGGNIVEFENIRLRQATVKIDQGAGINAAVFTNVDRVKNIIVRRESSGECCVPGGLALHDTQVEFGGVSLQTTGGKNDTSAGSFLFLNDGTDVATKVLHRTKNVAQSMTWIQDGSTIDGFVKIFNKNVRRADLNVSESGLGNTLLFDNDFSRTDANHTASVQLMDSIFGGTVQVQNSRTGELDLDIDNAAFAEALLIRHADGGSDAKIVDAGVGSTFLFQAKTGEDKLFIDDSIFHGKATINTGGKSAAADMDSDLVSIETGSFGRDSENTEFLGTLTISTGAGDDVVALGGDEVLPQNLLNVRGSAKLNAGNGSDGLLLGRWTTFDLTPVISGFEIE